MGLSNYSGDFTKFPDVRKIEEMIKEYSDHNAPIAYTLDVAVESDYTTAPIEVHDFFSCGLYGFRDWRLYPIMLSRWIHEWKN